VFVFAAVCASVAAAAAQQLPLERLPPQVLDVTVPSARVRGVPGTMAIQQRPCRVLPASAVRRRIVDVAAQEWGFFGFRTVDRTEVQPRVVLGAGDAPRDGAQDNPPGGRRRSRLSPGEASRVASSIAGYWAVTPEGAWIVGRQNDEWKGPDGIAARWNAPWSAAFISWVMCEAGLGMADTFARAIAHHAYIDQAIRARDGRSARAAFVAYDIGESPIAPGDLLCSARRPVYRTVAERRRQMGVGARTHCDIVVKIDEAMERILVVGGNVRATVTLKVLRAERQAGKPLGVMDPDEERPIFAHLKLRADALPSDALDTTPTMKQAGCMLLADAIAVGPRPDAARIGGVRASC
jgi:hypothetical protein